MTSHIIQKDSQFVSDLSGSVGYFHNNLIHFYCDLLNGGDPIYLLPLELNIEIIIAFLILGRKDVVAGGWKLEEISIESLEMIVSPSTAELAFVRVAPFYFVEKKMSSLCSSICTV